MKEIQLTGGKVAIVDDSEYNRLMAMGKWNFSTWGYAVHSIGYKDSLGKKRSKAIRMHRVIMNAPKGMEVDHISGDKLDNRKDNLRLCTQVENKWNMGVRSNNTSGFKGVHWNTKNKKWAAQIQVNFKRIHLGLFPCPIEAACAYNAFALEYHGEFARLNSIPEDYTIDNEKINLLFKSQWNGEIRINNASGFRGVAWSKIKGKWGAKIQVNYKQLYLGYFDSPIEAARVYNAAAIEHFGESAKLNAISEEPNSLPQFLNLSA